MKPQGLQRSPSPSEAPFLQFCSFPSLSTLSPPKIVTYVLTSVGFSLIYDLCPSQVGIFLIDSVNPADVRCVLLEFWFTFSQKLKPCHKAEVTCELNRILSYVLERGHLRNTLFILKTKFEFSLLNFSISQPFSRYITHFCSLCQSNLSDLT